MSEDINVDEYFNKNYEFVGNEGWALPAKAYFAPPWSIKGLQQMKLELNTVKGQLNKYSLPIWSNHTKSTDPSSLIKSAIGTNLKIELLTQAWCKFYECLNTFDVIPNSCIKNKKLHTVHLCEAPGAFISALNYYLHTNHPNIKWKWNANTLNPYYEGNDPSEMILDDSLIHQTIPNWEFCLDETGDIRKLYNHQELVSKFSSVDLITADGSVDCMKDPGEQEQNVHHLHYCEVVTALKILRTGGNFVLKLFTMYEHGTVCLMYLLNCCFEKIYVSKPCSSKSGNSEVYVVCSSYRGFGLLSNLWDSLLSCYDNNKEEAMFDLSQINTSFLVQLEECSKYFMDLQCDRINRNIKLFETDDSDKIWDYVKTVQYQVSEVYTNICHVVNIPKNRRLIWRSNKKCQITYQEELHVKVTHANTKWDDDNLITISIGRAFDVVQSSCFGCTSIKSSSGSIILPEDLAPTYVVINGSSFETEISQSALHRRFFNLVVERSRCHCDFVIYGIPLLTRFLVGILYILSLGFESFVVSKGVIVFRNYNEFKFYILRRHFENILGVYDRLKSKEFTEDILEVVSLNLLKKGNFYKAICKYNNERCT